MIEASRVGDSGSISSGLAGAEHRQQLPERHVAEADADDRQAAVGLGEKALQAVEDRRLVLARVLPGPCRLLELIEQQHDSLRRARFQIGQDRRPLDAGEVLAEAGAELRPQMRIELALAADVDALVARRIEVRDQPGADERRLADLRLAVEEEHRRRIVVEALDQGPRQLAAADEPGLVLLLVVIEELEQVLPQPAVGGLDRASSPPGTASRRSRRSGRRRR